ncbi:MAG TPA: hypothetical protein VKF41_04525 [Bryobacteraceae bacterium]|nr:hypothetical protein [Bryobacteraceae bacterium]
MPRQFLYTGHAVGFSARITAPFDEVVEAQAASSLGIAGGYSSARVDNFRHRELLSFASAHTQVSGILSRKTNAFETLVSGVLEGLNLVDMVKADYVVGRLMSRHPQEPPPDGPDEPFITPVGSEFGKIRVAGYELTPVIDVNLFNRFCSYTDLCAEISRSKDLRARFNAGEEGAAASRLGGMLVGSIVSEIHGGGPGIEIAGHIVFVPGFGKLHFGEIVISQYSRRLAMLRAELGCPVDMDASGPDMGGNGHPP